SPGSCLSQCVRPPRRSSVRAWVWRVRRRAAPALPAALSFAIARPSHPQASSVLRLPARRNATASGGRDPAHASPRAEFARGVLESAPAPRASTPKLAIECLRATPLDRPHLHGEVQTI